MINLQSSIGRYERHQLLDDKEQKQGKPENIIDNTNIWQNKNKPSYVEIPLSSEEPHVHLHLSIKMTHSLSLLLLFLTAVLLHLPDRVQEEQD